MPRSRVTLADLKQRLRERVGDTSTFWNDVEARDALNEAISVWQALSGEWITRMTISAESDSPSFYPVAKQIVSLTRVNYDAGGVTPPLVRLRIAPSNVFRNPRVDPVIYHTASEVVVVWNAIAVNGVKPYTYEWTFPPEFDLEPDSTRFERNPRGRFNAEGTFTITCTAVDASDELVTATFDLTVISPTVTVTI